MMLLKIFLTFLKIGAVSFGGGYAMIPIIREAVLENGWLTESEFMNFIAVSESTPGPIAINIATFVGSNQMGILGAFFATLGVVLPSFIIMILITMLLKNLLKYPVVGGFLSGVRPCVVALILSTGITLFLSTLVSFRKIGDTFSPDIKGIAIFAIILVIGLIYKKLKKKKISPILLIIISAILGIVFYGIL